jgi:hypothetical protein
MTTIQVILTVGLIVTGIYMYLRLRTSLTDVLLIVLFITTGVFFVLFPDVTNRLAKLAGVGRGADLIFYLGFLFMFFVILKLYSRIRNLERHLTESVRKKSIDGAEELGKK